MIVYTKYLPYLAYHFHRSWAVLTHRSLLGAPSSLEVCPPALNVLMLSVCVELQILIYISENNFSYRRIFFGSCSLFK